MKTTAIVILCATIAAGVVFPLGYILGNRKAAALAYEELRAVSTMGYEDCSTLGAKRAFANHVCSVLARELDLHQHPLSVLRQHRGSYERAVGTRREKAEATARSLEKWNTRLKNPEPSIGQVSPEAAPSASPGEPSM